MLCSSDCLIVFFFFQAGTKRNQGCGRGRGLTLCLKVWNLPKGVRIPVLLNASGEPVGKEAGTLSTFLGALARDGILAPLTHQDWRRVPEKNKDVMYHIVKVCSFIWLLLLSVPLVSSLTPLVC